MKIAWASCDETQFGSPGWDSIASHAPTVFVNQGDAPYCNGASNNLWGYGTMPAFSATTTQAEALAKYQQFWSKPSAARLLARRALGMHAYYQPDDHEYDGDNWDHTLDGRTASFTSQALVNQHWNRCVLAQEQFFAASWDNPPANSAGAVDRPSGALGSGENPPASQYPIRYFVADYTATGVLVRKVIGPTAPAATGAYVRMIFPDNLVARSPVAATDNASKIMFGPQQMAWLQSALEAAVAAGVAFVLIVSTKKLLGAASGDNTDIWPRYGTQQATLMAMIDATGAKPIWLSGDRHRLQVSEQRRAAGAACDIIDLCACPIGVTVESINTAAPGLLWTSPRQGYGLITITDGQAIAEVRESNTRSVLWRAAFHARSNVPIYTDVQASRL